MQGIPVEALAGQPHTYPGSPAPGHSAAPSPTACHHIPDLFLYSISNPVMMLLPSNRCVHRKFILRAFTSRISSSGGSGGSWGHRSRLGTTGREASQVQGDPPSEASHPGAPARGNGYLGR